MELYVGQHQLSVPIAEMFQLFTRSIDFRFIVNRLSRNAATSAKEFYQLFMLEIRSSDCAQLKND